ncbi:hypothetical protein SOP87_30335, partial [Bacillus cereus]|uniref:hypothetical protein n=2 Tax=Bacillus TaxID=1386 RepID=UPI002B2536DC
GSLLINTYKDRVLINLSEFKKNKIVLENIQNDIANIDEEFRKWAFKDFYKDAVSEDSNTLEVKYILKVKIDVETYGENIIMVGKNSADTIIGLYENYLMEKLQRYMEKLNLKFRDTDKISRTLKGLEELNKKYDLEVNSKITSTNFEQKFLAFEDRGSIENYNFQMDKILMQQF